MWSWSKLQTQSPLRVERQMSTEEWLAQWLDQVPERSAEWVTEVDGILQDDE